MKTNGIEREDIILMLTDINQQLDKLENELHSSTEEFCNSWYQSQENRLNQCDNKLSALEENIDKLDNGKQTVKITYPSKKVVKLELGY
jgi:DNA phosphorothioation-dependent restriction protein DptG